MASKFILLFSFIVIAELMIFRADSIAISMPMLNEMKASMKADLDVTALNRYLEQFVPREVQKGIEATLASAVQNITEEVEARLVEIIEGRQHVAFFAKLGSSKTGLRGGDVLVFDSVALNEGNAYDKNTGKFTCPEDGLYTFSWTTVSKFKTDFSTVLVVNGLRKAANIVDNDSVADDMTGSATVVVEMKHGEQAWLVMASYTKTSDYMRADWNGDSCSMFSGFRIN